MIKRHKTRKIKVGNLFIGGDAPILVQSMTKTDTRDTVLTVKQIKDLEDVGCEVVRCAVPDFEAAQALGQIKKQIKVPLVADIHFDYRLALEAIKQGADKIRVNPGNIGTQEKLKTVVLAAKKKGVPIRIGVNAGSLEKDLLVKYGKVTPEGLVESAGRQIKLLEDMQFFDIVVSLKTSDVLRTIRAYHLFSNRYDYPLHLGVTEAGTTFLGTVKSSVGIGILLSEGIGDTLRVSLTGDPKEEVKVGFEILKSLEIRQKGPVLISCPTCGRCQIDLRRYTQEIERALEGIQKPLRVAVMGCVVNGPGEAREADIGIAGGKGQAVLFIKGKIIDTFPEKEIVQRFLKEIKKYS